MSFYFVCALCNSPNDLWYIVTQKPECDLPLTLGDIVCKTCSETLPKPAQDVLYWSSTAQRLAYLNSKLLKEP